MKLYISPHPSGYQEDGVGSGGIWRVINAQAKWLPQYDIELVDDPKDSDMYCIHAGAFFDWNKPAVQTCHGFYWTGDFHWERNYWQYNAAVIEASRRALNVITPSEWVAYPIRRDMRKSAISIPHGVNLEEFPPQSSHDRYVLWGKPRVDVVCDPTPVGELARLAPTVDFLTTYGVPINNVTVIGAMTYANFQKIMSRAMIWLATARETGDIGSREAMARGIPVLGWNHGATAELVRHGETGYLAEVDNYTDLLNGLNYCIQNRDRLGTAAREDVKLNYQWKDAMARYAQVFHDTLAGENYPIEISVVVPTYNYAHFLGECLESVRDQTFYQQHPNKVEVIVVDDASTDDTQKLLEMYTQPGFRTIKHDNNRGLPASLNTGHSAARGRYIVNLDADNVLIPDALETLYLALEKKTHIDVASGGLAIYMKDGKHRQATDWPFGKIAPLDQLNHINQLTSSSMMRASSVRRLGGYRERQVKNEDGEFWCRAISAGLRFEQVTQSPTLVYRWHDDNKSKTEGGEDDPEGPLAWNFYYPWRKMSDLMPYSSTVPAKKGSWAVRSYERPHIAIVIPCGPGHQGFLMDALDSVAAQTFNNIECIVANDTGEPLDVAAMGHPWVTVVDTAGRQGPAIARNTAIAVARAPLIIPLDADDMLYPDAVLRFYQAWLQYPEDIVYADCITQDAPGKEGKLYHSGPWSWEKVSQEAVYQDVILFAKQWWYVVGGYPTDQFNGEWEDWLFGVKLHLIGIGATYIEKPWGVYRRWATLEGGKSKNDMDSAGQGTKEWKAKCKKFGEWIRQQEVAMPCKGCGGKRRGRTASISMAKVNLPQGKDIIVMYDGPREGSISVNSRAVPGRKYHIRRGEEFVIPAGDTFISSLPGFVRVEVSAAAAPDLPKEQPAPPIASFEAKVPPPPVSFAELIAREVEKVEIQRLEEERLKQIGGNGLMELKNLTAIKAQVIKDAGFDTAEKIREDIVNNNGAGILAIKGIGASTLRRVQETVDA